MYSGIRSINLDLWQNKILKRQDILKLKSKSEKLENRYRIVKQEYINLDLN